MIAKPLGRDLLEMAYGVHIIANANMMRAVKAVSTNRGRDPRDIVMLAFGGSGGVHAVELARFADLRYTGQAYELTVPLPEGGLTPESISGLAEAFEAEHERTYGHRFPGKKAIQTIKLRLIGTVIPEGRPSVDFAATLARAGGSAEESRRITYFGAAVGPVEPPVLSNRAALAGTPGEGPLVIEEYGGTFVVPPGARASLDQWANIAIETPV